MAGGDRGGVSVSGGGGGASVSLLRADSLFLFLLGCVVGFVYDDVLNKSLHTTAPFDQQHVQYQLQYTSGVSGWN
jgi:hypothetical protein